MRLWLPFSVLCALGCTHNEMLIAQDAENFVNKPTIIFVPGYYGTQLREVESHERVFVTAREILFGRRALSLMQNELATPPGPTLEPDGILKSVPVVPGVYAVDVYGNILSHLAALPDTQVIPFAYDWRQDLVAAAAKLQDLIARLRGAGVKDIRLVAHSMGGMVTLYSLAYGKQDVESPKLDWRGAEGVRAVAFLGVPFGGVLSPFRNMYRGTALSYNKHYFPGATVASFPASYQLTTYKKITVHGGEAFDMSSPEVWRAMNAGLYQNFASFTPEVRAARERYTAEQVTHGADFAKALSLEGGVAPPNTLAIMNVIGRGARVMTSFYARSGDPQNPFIFDVVYPKNDELLYSDGDGTVSVEAGERPAPLRASGYPTLSTRFGHGELFNDPPIRSALDQFLKK